MLVLDFPLRAAFLALPLADDAKSAFRKIHDQLQPFADCLNFQNPESPHLTLYFWKELMEIEYNQVMQQAPIIASKTSSFELTINGADTFGRTGDERVLFLTVSFSPELATIKKLCPWPNPPDQPFTPHVTMARISHPGRFTIQRKKIMKVLSDINIPTHVDRMRLYAEVEGEKQTALQDFCLTP